MADANNDLTGVWRSTYRYTSSSRDGEFTSEHFVRLKRQGASIVLESLPRDSRSYLLIRMSLQGNIATGSWQEETDPHGYYKGAVYHGAIQMVVHDDGKQMRGKWLGYGKDMKINVGPWELAYVGDTAPVH